MEKNQHNISTEKNKNDKSFSGKQTGQQLPAEERQPVTNDPGEIKGPA